jgi:hypothetical protein
MPQRSARFVGNSFPTTYVRVTDPDWRPLEAVSSLVRQRPDLPHFHPGEFMYMAAVRSTRPDLVIHLYKHVDTRRYLNLDDAGHAYAYIDSEGDRVCHGFSGRYRRHGNLVDALDRLELHLFETVRLWRSFPPEQWPPAG